MSKAKREQQKKARERAVRRQKNRRFLVIFISVLLVVGLAGGVGGTYYYNNFYLTRPVDDYSAELTDEGLIKDININDYVTLGDYKNITISKSDIEFTEEDWEAYINPLLIQYGISDDTKGQVVEMGDTINLDYTGTIDGVAFDGGSTEGSGTQITLGSANYIDGFEDQVAGHKTGESFDINVTFPEDYGDENLNGKDAVFAITINSKNVPTEYNDDFVASYLAEDNESLTAEEYKEKYMAEQYQVNYRNYVDKCINSRANIISYPDKYLRSVKGLLKNQDLSDYNSYNEYYEQYLGKKLYEKFSDYTGLDNKEYEASLSNKGAEMVEETLVLQAIYEDANLSATDDNLDEALASFGVERQYYPNFEERYGKGYMNQLAIKYAVQDYIDSLVTITED